MLFDLFSDRTRFLGSLESAAGVGVPVLALFRSAEALCAFRWEEIADDISLLRSAKLPLTGTASSISIESCPDAGVSVSATPI